MRHHLRVVEEAARRHIAINAHEPVKDTGLRRTYPNWVSREGARGMEYNAWGDPPNPPEHEVNLVFTRMLAGPMDFTPGVLSLTGAGGKRIQSTLAKQLALYVVLYSPIQMAADLPENYARFPKPFQFIKDVPVDWADTRVLNGEVGDYVDHRAQGPQQRRLVPGCDHGRAAAQPAGASRFPRRRPQVLRDYLPRRQGRGLRGRPGQSIEIDTRPMSRRDTLELRLAPGGGLAMRISTRPGARLALALKPSRSPTGFDVECAGAAADG